MERDAKTGRWLTKMAGLTKEEKRAHRRQVHRLWRERNWDKYQQYQHEYSKKHAEKKSARTKQWALDNPDKVKARKRRPAAAERASYLKYAYGISEADYQNMFMLQGGLCAICKIEQQKKLHVDHDHISGRVRGLLCGLCNRGLGTFKDCKENLLSAAAYLDREIVESIPQKESHDELTRQRA